jgi:hypothetical protein
MNKELLITFEILLVVVSPLILLYLKSNWHLRTIVLCLLTIPVLWYLTYAFLHEMSHVAGTYLVGGAVVDYKLIPRFWLGELGTAWIRTEGLAHAWQQLVSTGFPYILNVICIFAGFVILNRRFSGNPFVVGLVFMLLCLRPAFDFLSELTGYVSGNRGDYYAIRMMIGSQLFSFYVFCSVGLSLVSIVAILRRFAGFPETKSSQPTALS